MESIADDWALHDAPPSSQVSSLHAGGCLGSGFLVTNTLVMLKSEPLQERYIR